MIPVKPHIQQHAHIRSREEYERLYRLSLDNPEWFWSEQAKAIAWFHPWTTVLVEAEHFLRRPDRQARALAICGFAVLS